MPVMCGAKGPLLDQRWADADLIVSRVATSSDPSEATLEVHSFGLPLTSRRTVLRNGVGEQVVVKGSGPDRVRQESP